MACRRGLLTIYCASEAIRTRSPEIYLGRSVQEFLRRLDVPITRGERGSLRVYANQLLRLIHCAVSIDENIRDASGRTGLHIRQALFARRRGCGGTRTTGVGQGSSLVLSSVLFESILERSAPLSTAAIRQLRKSPMDLDVYAWLVHRLFHLSRPSTVTWAAALGSVRSQLWTAAQVPRTSSPSRSSACSRCTRKRKRQAAAGGADPDSFATPRAARCGRQKRIDFSLSVTSLPHYSGAGGSPVANPPRFQPFAGRGGEGVTSLPHQRHLIVSPAFSPLNRVPSLHLFRP